MVEIMKQTELRIGNLFAFKGHVGVIRQIYLKNGIYVVDLHFLTEFEELGELFSSVELEAEQIDPIPLSEEHLLKFGFQKKSEYDWSSGEYSDNKPNIDVYNLYYNADGYDNVMLISFSFKYGCEQVLFDLKFVHQLQNLFHSLTGEELIILK